MPLSYEEFAALPTDIQVKFEQEYPDESFPIRIPNIFTVKTQLSLAARFSVPLALTEQLIVI